MYRFFFLGGVNESTNEWGKGSFSPSMERTWTSGAEQGIFSPALQIAAFAVDNSQRPAGIRSSPVGAGIVSFTMALNLLSGSLILRLWHLAHIMFPPARRQGSKSLQPIGSLPVDLDLSAKSSVLPCFSPCLRTPELPGAFQVTRLHEADHSKVDTSASSLKLHLRVFFLQGPTNAGFPFGFPLNSTIFFGEREPFFCCMRSGALRLEKCKAGLLADKPQVPAGDLEGRIPTLCCPSQSSLIWKAFRSI